MPPNQQISLLLTRKLCQCVRCWLLASNFKGRLEDFVMNYSRFISQISKARKPSALRESTSYVVSAPPTLISLGGGIPNPTTFPYKSIRVEAKDGSEFTVEGSELSRALQYSETTGIPELRSWLETLHRTYHDPPLMKNGKFDICVTAGCQDGLSKVLTSFLSPGDHVLVEDPVYTGALSVLDPLPVKILGVKTDDLGLDPDSLLKVLSKWSPKDALDPESDIPKLLYTVPNCGNPTGASTSTERKKRIYQIAQTYNLLLIEDDPYFLLQFKEELDPSYQSMDSDGRVIRCDSMSKILSAGFRIGWVSGPKPLMERIILDQQSNVMHCNTVTQTLAIKLLDIWKMEGFKRHLESIRTFYKSQRDAAINSLTKWLSGVAEWNVPTGGMFLWIKIPKVQDTREMILKRAFAKEVVLIPGSWFSVDPVKPSSYCRISFSSASPAEMDEGIRRFSEVVRDEISAL